MSKQEANKLFIDKLGGLEKINSIKVKHGVITLKRTWEAFKESLYDNDLITDREFMEWEAPMSII